MSGQYNYTEDQLRELELWPLVSLQQGTQVAVPASVVEQSPTPSRVASPAPAQRAPAIAAIPVVMERKSNPGLGEADWASLKERVEACHACELSKRRNRTVFGVGNQSAPWLFVGEGPGMEEDQAGEPFVGQAGKLLDAMLASIQLSRQTNVYIVNVVKCRPPGNRTPLNEEASACADFLDRQIDLVSPKIIVALGKTAATRLTGQEASLASQRGKDFNYRGFPLLVTYHPAYLLRNLPDKAKAWEDLLRAKRIFAEQG